MFPIPLLQGPNIRQAYRYARQQGKFKWKVNTNTQGSRFFRLWIHISWIQQTPKKCTNEQDRSRCALRTWWEFTFCLKKTCSSVSKAIYLVRLWWRRWIGVGFMCARGASIKVTVHHLQSRRYYHASELWREGHWKFAATLLHILLEQWSFLVCFFWGDSTSQRKLTTNPFVRIPMNEPQWTLASTGLPLGRHHLQRWSGKSLKGRMAKKQLMLEAQFMPLVPRRATYT